MPPEGKFTLHLATSGGSIQELQEVSPEEVHLYLSPEQEAQTRALSPWSRVPMLPREVVQPPEQQDRLRLVASRHPPPGLRRPFPLPLSEQQPLLGRPPVPRQQWQRPRQRSRRRPRRLFQQQQQLSQQPQPFPRVEEPLVAPLCLRRQQSAPRPPLAHQEPGFRPPPRPLDFPQGQPEAPWAALRQSDRFWFLPDPPFPLQAESLPPQGDLEPPLQQEPLQLSVHQPPSQEWLPELPQVSEQQQAQLQPRGQQQPLL